MLHKIARSGNDKLISKFCSATFLDIFSTSNNHQQLPSGTFNGKIESEVYCNIVKADLYIIS